MATYERWELQINRVEFRVPAEAPWGAAWVEVYKAVAVARAELVALGVIEEGRDAPGDMISIAPGDDCVIVSYERRASSAVPA
jgi:hypothetical protein